MYTQSLFFSKKAEHGQLAHVYEHAFANALEKELERTGLFLVTDYNIWGKTYGQVCIIELKVYSRRALRGVKAAFKRAQATSIDTNRVEQAILECGLEYDMQPKYTALEAAQAINTLHHQKWQNFSEFDLDRAEPQTSVNTNFETHGIQFSHAKSAQNQEYTLELKVRAPQNDDAALQALGVLMLQALSQNSIRTLRNQFTLYEIEDEWHNGAKKPAYRNHLIIEKNTDETAFRASIDSALTSLRENDVFLRSLSRLLSKAYQQQDAPYFSIEAMNRITDGTIVGGAAWKRVSSIETVRSVAKSIEWSVL